MPKVDIITGNVYAVLWYVREEKASCREVAEFRRRNVISSILILPNLFVRKPIGKSLLHFRNSAGLHCNSIATALFICVIRPHRPYYVRDAVYSYRPNSVVCRSLCHTKLSAAKTAEPIEIPFGLWAHMGSRNYVLDGVQIPMGRGNFLERGTNIHIINKKINEIVKYLP